MEGAPDVSLTSGMSEEERKQRVCLTTRFKYLQSLILNFTGERGPSSAAAGTIYEQWGNHRVFRIEFCFLGDLDESTEKNEKVGNEDNVKEAEIFF